MKYLKIVVLVGWVMISRVGLGQGREEIGLPGYQHGESVKSVKLYPNPAIEFLTLRLESPGTHHLTVTVHNIIGNSVEVESEIIDEHEIRIKVKDLSSGYYLLALNDENSGFKGVYKFLKK